MEVVELNLDPKFEDTYTKRVMALVRQKDQGKEIVISEPAGEKGQVVDLMEALKATLANHGGPGRRARLPAARQPARSTARKPGRRTGRRAGSPRRATG